MTKTGPQRLVEALVLRSGLCLLLAGTLAEASVRIASSKNITQCLGVKKTKSHTSLVLEECLDGHGAAWAWDLDTAQKKGALKTGAGCVGASPLKVVDCDKLGSATWSWDPTSMHIRSGDHCLEVGPEDELRMQECKHLDLKEGTRQEQNGQGAISVQSWVLLPTHRPQVDILDKLKFPLRAHKSSIIDSTGRRVKLAGVNWFGAHMEPLVNNGLETAPISRIAKTIKHMGFNSVRMNYALSMLDDSEGFMPDVPEELQPAIYKANPELKGLSAMEVFDRCIEALTDEGLLVIINNHMGEAGWCCTGSDGSELWFGDKYSKQDWLHSLTMMAARYKDNKRVVGIDLLNEPRMADATKTVPWWGIATPVLRALGFSLVDWRLAASEGSVAVWRGNPDALSIIEGQLYATNLMNVIKRPISVADDCLMSRVVYESHEYFFFWILYRSWSHMNSFANPFRATNDIAHFSGPGTESAGGGNSIGADYGVEGGDSLLSYQEWKRTREDAVFWLAWNDLAPVWVGEFGTNLKEGNSWWKNVLRLFRVKDTDWCYWPLDPEKVPVNGKLNGTVLKEGMEDSYGVFDSKARDYSAVVGWKLQDLISIQAPDTEQPEMLPKPQECMFDLERNLEALQRSPSIWEEVSTFEPQFVASAGLVFLFLWCMLNCAVCGLTYVYATIIQPRLFGRTYRALAPEGQVPLADPPKPNKHRLVLGCLLGSCCALLITVVVVLSLSATYEPAFEDETLTLEDTLPGMCTKGGFDHRCYGATGSNCEKVPKLDTCPDGQQVMSVGSLLHDTCCEECREGAMCDIQDPGVWKVSLNLLDMLKPCAYEWRKATNNLIDGRFWCATFNHTERSTMPDVTVSDQVKEWVPTLYTGMAKGRRSVRLSNFNVARKDCAPKGTPLDCPNCDPCHGDGPFSCEPSLGDSDFCCSGRFSEVHSDKWGKCA